MMDGWKKIFVIAMLAATGGIGGFFMDSPKDVWLAVLLFYPMGIVWGLVLSLPSRNQEG